MGTQKKYNKIVIGVDQSYTATGISVAIDGRLHRVTSTQFKGCESRSEKRRLLANMLHKLILQSVKVAAEVTVICERIRTFSGGGKGKKNEASGLRPGYLKMTGALIATIVDTAAEYNVLVYSVDTRSWKSQVVGTSKAGKGGDKKEPTIRFVEKLGFDMFIRTNKVGRDLYDDDAADSGCIALYGFIDKKKQKLVLEE